MKFQKFLRSRFSKIEISIFFFITIEENFRDFEFSKISISKNFGRKSEILFFLIFLVFDGSLWIFLGPRSEIRLRIDPAYFQSDQSNPKASLSSVCCCWMNSDPELQINHPNSRTVIFVMFTNLVHHDGVLYWFMMHSEGFWTLAEWSRWPWACVWIDPSRLKQRALSQHSNSIHNTRLDPIQKLHSEWGRVRSVRISRWSFLVLS